MDKSKHARSARHKKTAKPAATVPAAYVGDKATDNPTPRRWTWRTPVEGAIRPSAVIKFAQSLADSHEIIFPINIQSLRAWATGKHTSDVFPVPADEIIPLGDSCLYPAGADALIAFWYDGRQRHEDESVWRGRMRRYLKSVNAEPYVPKGQGDDNT